jgi:hypothetical protein
MKKFMCDICQIEVKQYDLTELYSWYQIGGIVDVCSDCNKEISNAQSRIYDALKPIKHSWVKKIILKMKNR